MDTQVINLKKGQNDQELSEAAIRLREGALVAFPTETVYGLGVNALKEENVKKIFQVKGRSFMNPLALHLPSVDDLGTYVRNVPPEAERLIENFIPGPLMLLFEKTDKISDIVTAGSRKVGVRVPRNTITSELLKRAEVPVVATSANISGRFSPLTSEHVMEELGGKIEIIIATQDDDVLGIESTILDVTTRPFRIIRSGFITQEQIAHVIGFNPMLSDDNRFPRTDNVSLNLKIILIEGEVEKVLRRMKTLINNLPPESQVGLLLTDDSASYIGDVPYTKVMGSRRNMDQIAKNLFPSLRAFEKEDAKIVLVEGIPRDGIGWAIMERLERVASEIIRVE